MDNVLIFERASIDDHHSFSKLEQFSECMHVVQSCKTLYFLSIFLLYIPHTKKSHHKCVSVDDLLHVLLSKSRPYRVVLLAWLLSALPLLGESVWMWGSFPWKGLGNHPCYLRGYLLILAFFLSFMSVNIWCRFDFASCIHIYHGELCPCEYFLTPLTCTIRSSVALHKG